MLQSANSISKASPQPWGGTNMDTRVLRDLLGSYPTGVAIVTTRSAQGIPVGLTINSFASLSLSPPLVLWSLASKSKSIDVFRHCSHFVINILADSQETLAKHFATPALPDKFQGVNAVETPEGFPAIEDAMTTLICINDHCREVGDHLLIVGKIVRSAHKPGKPLVFHGGKFRAMAEVL